MDALSFPFRAARPALLACLLLAAALPARADMYKWVDERGVVTYSNTPPPAALKKKVETVAERVSTYTPDAELNRAMSEAVRNEAKKNARLGRQLEAEREARRGAAAPPGTDLRLAAYERCRAERGVDCEAIRSGTPPGPAYGYSGYYPPQYVVGARPAYPVPFKILSVPDTRVGIDNRPPVGISTAPPVGASTAPRVDLDDRPPHGAPSRHRPSRYR